MNPSKPDTSKPVLIRKIWFNFGLTSSEVNALNHFLEVADFVEANKGNLEKQGRINYYAKEFFASGYTKIIKDMIARMGNKIYQECKQKGLLTTAQLEDEEENS